MFHPQEEIFDQKTITKFVSSAVGGNLHVKTLRSLSNAVLGLITSQNATIHSIGRGLAYR